MKTQWNNRSVRICSLLAVPCLFITLGGCAALESASMPRYTCADINAALLVTGNVESRLDSVKSKYKLGVGDTFESFVTQPYEPSVCGTMAVPPDGNMVCMGPVVHIAGLTSAEAEEAIAKAMKPMSPEYFRDIRASIVVVGFKSQKYTVTGEVNSAGEYPFDGDTSIVQAIARAKGVTSRAAWDHIRIVRATPTGPQTIEVNLADIVKGGQRDKNVPLCANDVIQVPAAGTPLP